MPGPGLNPTLTRTHDSPGLSVVLVIAAAFAVSFPVILRQGELFLLGDAREEAYDSRDFGVVKTSDVLGKVIG